MMCIRHQSGQRPSWYAYGAEHIKQVLEIRQRVDEFVQNTGESFANRMVIDRGKVEVDGHLLILLRGVEQFVYDALLNVAKIL